MSIDQDQRCPEYKDKPGFVHVPLVGNTESSWYYEVYPLDKKMQVRDGKCYQALEVQLRRPRAPREVCEKNLQVGTDNVYILSSVPWPPSSTIRDHVECVDGKVRVKNCESNNLFLCR